MPYLVGEVANYPLADKESGTDTAASRLKPWVVRYLDELSTIIDTDLDPIQLPDEPVTLAYLAATLLRIPEKEKQMLLTSVSTIELLTDLRRIFRREVAFLKTMYEHRVTDQGHFSLN
jgi:hypothetical protein